MGISVETLFVFNAVASVVDLWIITFVGILITTRPHIPSISQIIEDTPELRLMFGLYVGILTFLTGLLFNSTFYRIEGLGWIVNVLLPYVAIVSRILQLTCFGLVGMFYVTWDPTYHFVAAGGTAVFGATCEFILWYRRVLFDVTGEYAGTLFLNAFLFMWMYVSLFVFAGMTWSNDNIELVSDSGFAEWFGYYPMGVLFSFRILDVIFHRRSAKPHIADDEIRITDGMGRYTRLRLRNTTH